MNLYADQLADALRKQADNFSFEEFQPLLPGWLDHTWGMRLGRYGLYPWQALCAPAGLTHIVDHGYAHLALVRNAHRTVVTVHDLIPLLGWKGRLPGIPKKRPPLLVLFSLLALKRVKWIVAVSANTKNDLVNWLGCDPDKIVVIYSGIDTIFQPYEASRREALRQQYFGSDAKKTVLITGSQFYKNHETALKTIAQLRAAGRQDLILAKTGQPTPEWLELVKKYGLESGVVNLGFLPRAEMPDLYNAIDLLFFPSLYEGAGWPPLEAMACGIPVVTSNAASLPEVMGDIDLMCDPLDSLGFAQKIEHLLADAAYRERIIEKGRLQAAKFTWEVTARQMLRIYQQLSND